MRQIAVVINARLASTRLPNKLILPFSGKTLLTLALEKLGAMRADEKYLAAFDPEIISRYEPHKDRVGLLRRSAESVTKGQVPHRIAFQHYELVKSPYIMVMNPCHPMTNIQSYERAIEFFKQNDNITSLTSVREKINLFFDSKGRLINQSDEKEIKTHNQPPIYEMAHAFHIFPRDRFLNTGKLWEYDKGDPYLYSVSKLEALDVDDQEDFMVCESFFRAQYGAEFYV